MSYPQLSSRITSSTSSSGHRPGTQRQSRHLQQLMEFNQDIFRRSMLADVELLVDGQILKSHRSVLICFSPYLRRKLVGLDGMAIADKVEIPKVGGEEMQILLRYMYTGQLDINCNSFYDVFKAASFLEMNDVKHECLQVLEDKEDPVKTYFFVYVMSKKMGMQTNGLKSYQLLINRFEEAVFSKEFIHLEIANAIEILSANQIGARSEIIVFLAGLNWLNHDFPLRQPYAINIMSCVRFTCMNMEEIIACHNPPFLGQIMQIPEITMMMFRATSYVTAKSLGQDSWFKHYVQPPRVLTLQGMPIDLWNKGDPPESYGRDPRLHWPDHYPKEGDSSADPFCPWGTGFEGDTSHVEKKTSELDFPERGTIEEPTRIESPEKMSLLAEKDESHPFRHTPSRELLLPDHPAHHRYEQQERHAEVGGVHPTASSYYGNVLSEPMLTGKEDSSTSNGKGRSSISTPEEIEHFRDRLRPDISRLKQYYSLAHRTSSLKAAFDKLETVDSICDVVSRQVLNTVNHDCPPHARPLDVLKRVAHDMCKTKQPGTPEFLMWEDVQREIKSLQSHDSSLIQVPDHVVEKVIHALQAQCESDILAAEVIKRVAEQIGQSRVNGDVIRRLIKSSRSSSDFEHVVSGKELPRFVKLHESDKEVHRVINAIEKIRDRGQWNVIEILLGVVRQIGTSKTDHPLEPHAKSQWEDALNKLRRMESDHCSDRGRQPSQETVDEVLNVLPDSDEDKRKAVETLTKVIHALEEKESVHMSRSLSRTGWSTTGKNREHDPHAPIPVSEEEVKNIIHVLSRETESASHATHTLMKVTEMIEGTSHFCSPVPKRMCQNVLEELREIEPDSEHTSSQVTHEAVKHVFQVLLPPHEDVHEMRTIEVLRRTVKCLRMAKTQTTPMCTAETFFKHAMNNVQAVSKQLHSEQKSSQSCKSGGETVPYSYTPEFDYSVREVYQELKNQSHNRATAVEIGRRIVEEIARSNSLGHHSQNLLEDTLRELYRIEPDRSEVDDVTEHEVDRVIRSLSSNSDSESQAIEVLQGVVRRLAHELGYEARQRNASVWEKARPESFAISSQSNDADGSQESHHPCPWSDEGRGELERKHSRSQSRGEPREEGDDMHPERKVRSSTSLSFPTESLRMSKSQTAKKPQVLVMGGMNPQNLQKMGIGVMVLNFDPKKNKWTRYSTLPEPRHNHCAAFLNHCLYVTGGCDPRETVAQNHYSPLSTCFKLDTRTQKWTHASSMCSKRYDHGLAKYNGMLFAIGGQDENERLLKSVEVYDPKKNKWKTLAADMCCGRKAMGVATFGDQIWIAGGLTQPDQEVTLQAISLVDCFDPKERRWHFQINTLPSPRCYSSLAVCGGQMYCVGGIVRREKVQPSDEVWCFNGDARMWSKAPSLPSARLGGVAVAHGETLIVVGGFDTESNTTIRNVNYLTPGALSWEVAAQLPTNLYGFAAVAIN